MISGTSEKLSKSGPGYLLIITKMAQKLQETYGIIFEIVAKSFEKVEKYLENILPKLLSSMDKFEKFRNSCEACPPFVFEQYVWTSRTYLLKHILNMYFLKCFLWRRGSENDECSIKHICKSLDMNFISKNMTWKFGNFLFSGKGISKLFYFQERES